MANPLPSLTNNEIRNLSDDSLRAAYDLFRARAHITASARTRGMGYVLSRLDAICDEGKRRGISLIGRAS